MATRATSSPHPPAPPGPAGLRARPVLGAGQCMLLLDAGFLAIAMLAALPLLRALSPPGPAVAALPALQMIFLYALGLYRREALVKARCDLARVPVAACLAGLAGWLGLALLPPGWGSGAPHLVFLAVLPAFAAAGLLARMVFLALRRRGVFRRRLLVIGAGRRAWDLLWMLRQEARTLAFDVALIHDGTMGEVDPRLLDMPGQPVLPASADLLSQVRSLDPDQIVVAPDDRRGLAMEGLLACRMAGYPVNEYAGFLEREIGRIDLKRLDVGWLLYAEGFSTGVVDRLLKRLLDIAVSLVLLLLALPFLLAAAACVKWGDGGPVLYRQERVTRGGRVFRILKLRTMAVNAEANGAVWAARADPRITRTGAFLRRTRLDELPQLLNVLRGDMSFVGPRPERPEFIRGLAASLPLYEERHAVRAGLTGWAQVNYPYGATVDDARSKLSYDLFYVKNAGIVLDVLIILQTLRVVIWSGGAR